MSDTTRDSLRALVVKWRQEAKQAGVYDPDEAATLESCADELESVLEADR